MDLSTGGLHAVGTNCVGPGHRREPRSVFGRWYWHVRFGRRLVMDWTVMVTRDGSPHHLQLTRLEGSAIDEIAPVNRPRFVAMLRRAAQEGTYEYLPAGSPLVDENEDDVPTRPPSTGPVAVAASRPRSRLRSVSAGSGATSSVDANRDGRADQAALRTTAGLGELGGTNVVPFPGAPGCPRAF
jgi:hypothetical protein